MPRNIKVSEVMTRNVIAVRPETSARAIAGVLFRNRISAVPVVDETGSPIGIVTEGDLIPRRNPEQDERRDWWLGRLAEGEAVSPEFIAEIERHDRTARHIMSAPLITVPDSAGLSEVADVLLANHIKQAPVLKDGRLVGVISRADLVRSIAKPDEAGEPVASLEPSRTVVEGDEVVPPAPAKAPRADLGAGAGQLSADVLLELADRHKLEELRQREDDPRLAQEKRLQRVRELLAADLTDAAWSHKLREARLAASQGAKEYLLLRFPTELCTDHGRAVNLPDPSWPTTLRGIAAQVFTRWRSELRPMGFRLNARVIDFPAGVPGDIGLFLAWKE